MEPYLIDLVCTFSCWIWGSTFRAVELILLYLTVGQAAWLEKLGHLQW